jgi:hypothetical protein
MWRLVRHVCIENALVQELLNEIHVFIENEKESNAQLMNALKPEKEPTHGGLGSLHGSAARHEAMIKSIKGKDILLSSNTKD